MEGRVVGAQLTANTSDYSYGVYIFDAPVTQNLLTPCLDAGVASWVAATIVITVPQVTPSRRWI